MFGKKDLPEEPPRCEGCDGTGLVYVTDEEDEAARMPGGIESLALCGDCNGRGAVEPDDYCEACGEIHGPDKPRR